MEIKMLLYICYQISISTSVKKSFNFERTITGFSWDNFTKNMPPTYPCGICARGCRTNVIQCTSCNSWIHRRCLNMSPGLLSQWGSGDLKFLCPAPGCAYIDGPNRPVYNIAAALKRLSAALDSNTVNDCIEEERLLLRTYKVFLPDRPHIVPKGPSDKVSVALLLKLSPATLDQHTPLAVEGDGNCLFRAICRAMYGHEKYHLMIRLLTALEVASHPAFYDSSHSDYVDQIKDARVVTSPYLRFLRDSTSPGAYSDTLHIFAASAALGIAIRSYCPPTGITSSLGDTLNRVIRGRGVSRFMQPAITVMWTMCEIPINVEQFNPNHFVSLSSSPQSEIHIDLTYPKTPENDFDVEYPPLQKSPLKTTRKCSATISPQPMRPSATRSETSDEDTGADTSQPSPSSPVFRSQASPISSFEDTACMFPEQSSPPSPVFKRRVSPTSSFVDTTVVDDACIFQEQSSPTSPVFERQASPTSSFADSPQTAAVQGKSVGNPLPENQFMECAELVKQILKGENVFDSIPPGQKDNTYFLIKNVGNTERRVGGMHSHFPDDSGAWESKAATPVSLYMWQEEKMISTKIRGNVLKKAQL